MTAGEGDLDLRLLGPVRALRAGAELTLGSARRQAVVSVLALHVNHAVSREQLIAAVWGDAPPASATGNVYTYVSALRQTLEPDRDRWAAGELLTSGGGTYCLHLPAESIDVFRFEAHREQGKRHRAAGNREAELTALRAALGEWSGAALSGVPGPYAEAQRVRLAELRLACAERHAAVLLDLGRPDDAIAALRPEVEAHPLQESLHGLLMTALEATGHRAEALAVHDRLATLLREQTGTEPSVPLRAIHRRILTGPPQPAAPGPRRSTSPPPPRSPLTRSPAPPTTVPPTTEPDNPPADPAVLVGRDPEIALLQRACAGVAAGTGRSVRIEGTPGMGKSALLNVALRHALPAGVRVGWGVGDMLSRRTPFGVLLECVESALSTGPPSPALQGIFAVAAEALDGPGPQIIDRAADLIRQAAREAPLVLVVDDLHRADAATLRVWRALRGATGQVPLLLVAAVRPGADELAGMPADDAVVLTALTDDESVALVRAQNPEVGAPALPQILAEAGGNPYYLRNLARAGAPPDDGTPPPDDLVTAVQGHISVFAPETRHVLRTIAFLGDHGEPAEVAAAAGLSVPDMLRVVEPARAAGVLATNTRVLAFQHPIMARILRDATPAALRVTLHRSFAETLAAAGVAPDRVVTQLLAGPVPLDPGISHWLLDRVEGLAVRAPATTVRLLQRIHSPNTVDAPTRLALTAWLARLLYGLRRSAVSEAGWVAARTPDIELEAEMRWIAACSHDRRGDHEAAADIARTVLSARRFPEPWLDRFRMLIARLRVHLPGDPTMPRQNRSTIVGEKVISPQDPAVSSG